MKQRPQMGSFHEVLKRASVEILGEMLAAAGQPDKLLAAALRQALHLVAAPRGLVFDHDAICLAVGYSTEESQTLRQQRLAPLLTSPAEPHVRFYSGPSFTRPVPRAMGALGMAGVMAVPASSGAAEERASDPLAVLAVEREQPFSPEESQGLGQWLRLASVPTAVAREAARAARLEQSQKLRWTDLPLQRLEQVPALQQIERLVVAEALRRNQNNKTRAAAVLGMTREGLRKKLLRFGM